MRARDSDRSSSSGEGFVTGFVLGGAIFGVLGFILAPQISKAFLDEDQHLKMPKLLEKDPAQTKQELIDKIANLNASIDEVAAKLNGKEAAEAPADAASLGNGFKDLKKMLQL